MRRLRVCTDRNSSNLVKWWEAEDAVAINRARHGVCSFECGRVQVS
jgi:hypothetical protein